MVAPDAIDGSYESAPCAVPPDSLAEALAAAIRAACAAPGDADAYRVALLAECLQLDTAGQADMLDHFRALATAAMQCATGMLATMDADALEGIELATRRGARLVLEFGPLPAFDAVTLLLVEREGRRQAVSSISVNKAPTPC